MSDHDELRRLIGIVGELRAEIPPIPLQPYATWRASVDAHRAAGKVALQALAERENAEVEDHLNGAKITLCGIKSSSYDSVDIALANWQRAAELKLKMEGKAR